MFVAVQMVLAAGAVAVFLWLLIGSRPSGQGGEEFIDPDDPRQIALLIGMVGGGIADAAVAQFAVRRFQEIHGRRAATRDIGTIIGLMRRR